MRNINQRFDETALEEAFINLFQENGYEYIENNSISRNTRNVLIEEDIKSYLVNNYQLNNDQINQLINSLKNISISDLYSANKETINFIKSGIYLDDKTTNESIFVELIDFKNPSNNVFKFVNQFEIKGLARRIPDIVVFVNGLPLVVIEFKSAMREETNIYEAYKQLVTRYCRDIPELFKFNMFSVISDGVNTKVGSTFSDYKYFFTWKNKKDNEKNNLGFSSLTDFVEDLMDINNFLKILESFIYFPDTSTSKEKYLCRYPQFYAANILHESILENKHPDGSGKGGTYFGATGSGKSLTILFLSKLLVSNMKLKNPSIVIISDRTDLDDQLSKLFLNSKEFLGENNIINVESREDLKSNLYNIKSGGIYLTTIQKFNKDIGLLSDRENIICISDEAHRTQVYKETDLKLTDKSVDESYSFSRALRQSFPYATYVGFTGTPINETIDTFGEVVDSYNLEEAVNDGITTPIFYEGRSIKVTTNQLKLQEVEEYYKKCLIDGSNEYQINESKKAMSKLNSILGNPDRLELLSDDFINHYESRIQEGSYESGKVMIVCSKREIAFELYKLIVSKRPDWNKKVNLSSDSFESDSNEIEKIKLVITRNQDDHKELFDIAGNKKYRKKLDRLFKDETSNFKIAIVVDMWITGFDVPSLEGIYIDKPLKEHTLIQTISRVNRVYKNKECGLVVDYIGIKKSMNTALKIFTDKNLDNFKDVEESEKILFECLKALDNLSVNFKPDKFYNMTSTEKFEFLNSFLEFIQTSKKIEDNFMSLTKKLKSLFKICSSSELISQQERGKIQAYLAARAMIYKLTRGDAPDISLMNMEVSKLIEKSLISQEVDEIFKMGKSSNTIDIFNSENLKLVAQIQLPNSKLKILQSMVNFGIKEVSKINKIKSIDFTKKFQKLVESYNMRDDIEILKSELLEDLSTQFTDLAVEISNEIKEFKSLGINYEEKTYFDIFKNSINKYEFEYEDEKLLLISKQICKFIEEISENTDWVNREDLKASIRVELTLLFDKHEFPPLPIDKIEEIYTEVLNQAKNYSL